jgi:hypothetical protein
MELKMLLSLCADQESINNNELEGALGKNTSLHHSRRSGFVNFPEWLQVTYTFGLCSKFSLTRGPNCPSGSCKHKYIGDSNFPSALIVGWIVYEWEVAETDETEHKVAFSPSSERVRPEVMI